MKIALTGSHGVGKSTLAYFLQQEINREGKSVSITPEVPRLICEIVNDKEYFRRGRNSLLKQSLVLMGQLIIEEQNQKVDIQICDRTLFDHWAYSLSLFGDEIKVGDFKYIYEKFISDHCRTYDKIYYLPIEFSPIDDGVRESDEKFQTEIDSIIIHLFKTYNVDYITIRGSVEDRARIILETINH